MIDDRPFSIRYREQLQLEHNQRRATLLAEIAEAKLERRHRYLECGPEDDHVEVLEAQLRRIDAAWATDSRRWSADITEARALLASMQTADFPLDYVLANLDPGGEDAPPAPEMTEAEFADAVERLTAGLIPPSEETT